MISVDIADHRFQLRAAAVFTHDGHVLLHRLENDSFWALPGGRVELGEDARNTVVREMREELDQAIECTELLYIVENFFEHLSRRNHEIGLYFGAHFQPGSVLLDTSRCHFGVEGQKRLEFRWFSLEGLQDLDIRPSFLREALAKPAACFQHIVQRG